MKDVALDRYMLFFDNCAAMREAFRFSDRFTFGLAAARLASKGLSVAPDELRALHANIKEHVRFLSPLRDIEPAVISVMAERGDAEGTLSDLKAAYSALREHFSASEYVALAALGITVAKKGGDLDELAASVRAIYDAFRGRHRWATSHSEVLPCTVLALRGASPEASAEDAQNCYSLMRSEHKFRCAWSLAAKLTIDPREPAKKCADVAQIRQRLKKERKALTLYYALASLVSRPEDVLDSSDEALALFDTLRKEKGFSGLRMDNEERLMLSYMLTAPSDELFFLALAGYYEKQAAIAAAAAAT